MKYKLIEKNDRKNIQAAIRLLQEKYDVVIVGSGVEACVVDGAVYKTYWTWVGISEVTVKWDNT